MINLPRSLSFKVITVFIFTALILQLLLWAVLGMSFDKLLSDNIKPYLTDHLVALQKQIGIPPNITLAKRIAEEQSVLIEIHAPGYQWSSHGHFLEQDKLNLKLQHISNNNIISSIGFYEGHFILITYTQGYIISLRMLDAVENPVKTWLLWLTFVIIFLIVGALFIIISYLFSPVKIIESGVRRIGDGLVGHRLSVNRQDELGSLSQSINKMADNIEQMLETKRQLLLAISHELRTPITRTKVALSMLENSETKELINEDIQEMEDLIAELLESERLRTEHATLEKELSDVNHIIHQVKERFFANSPLILTLDELPIINIDCKRIGLALKNTIKNALTASDLSQDSVTIKTFIDNNHLLIQIIDTGCGIDAKDIPLLTEPFYRPDNSRQRKTGGFGLGLHLTHVIMQTHNGGLRIDSKLNKGTTVTLSLPIV